MRTLIPCLVLLIIAAPAIGVYDEEPDTIGWYFDAGGTSVDVQRPIYSPFDMYLVVTNPTFGTLTGFQAGYRVGTQVYGLPMAFYILEEDLYGGENSHAGNTGMLGEHVVAWGVPRTSSTATVLVHWTGMILVPQGVFFYVEPVASSTVFEGQMAAFTPDGPVPLRNASYRTWCGCTLANFFLDIIPTERSSWGEVKSLFR